MTGSHHPFRVLKKSSTGLIYVALIDLVSYFETKRNESKTTLEEELWDSEADKFRTMIYEGLNHDL